MTDKITEDAIAIAKLIGVKDAAINRRTYFAEAAIGKMVTAQVVSRYTMLDQVLADIIFVYFFGAEPSTQRFETEWADDKHRIFFHHILDGTFLLKKLAIVHAISPVPSETTATFQRVNAVRIALAHSFIPESRKEYKVTGKVLYAGIDLRALSQAYRSSRTKLV